MTTLLAIKFRLLEPLMLRGPGEFDPSSRGVYTYASSLALPRPSTLVGALLSTILPMSNHLSDGCLHPRSWEDLVKRCYIKVFDEFGIEAIRGPYIIRKGNLYVPITLERDTWLIDYNQVSYLLRKYRDAIEEMFKEGKTQVAEKAAAMRLLKKDITYLRRKGYVLEPRFSDFTGIHLRSRDLSSGIGKVVKEGYIYTARYVAYPIDTELLFIIAISEKSNSEVLKRYPVIKFGGEHRAVKVCIEQVDGSSVVYMVLSNIKEMEYAILVSPMLLKEDDKVIIPFMGRYTISGHGYSLSKRRRKPISSCIEEGSIVRIAHRKSSSLKEVLRYGLYSVVSLASDDYYKYIGRLGYASFLPITLGGRYEF